MSRNSKRLTVQPTAIKTTPSASAQLSPAQENHHCQAEEERVCRSIQDTYITGNSEVPKSLETSKAWASRGRSGAWMGLNQRTDGQMNEQWLTSALKGRPGVQMFKRMIYRDATLERRSGYSGPKRAKKHRRATAPLSKITLKTARAFPASVMSCWWRENESGERRKHYVTGCV